MNHYRKVLFRIFTSKYPYSKTRLLIDYVQLVLNAYVHHKIRRSSDIPTQPKRIFGFTVHFHNYAELINLFEEIFIYQAYELHSDRENPVIIDAGSHIGLATLYFKKLYPDCRIMAFEPNRDSYDLLIRNIRQNQLAHVDAYNFALSDRNEKTTLYHGGVRINTITSSIKHKLSERLKADVITTRLSDHIQLPIDLLKLDVEGSETEIIAELISADKLALVKRMVIEFHPTISGLSLHKFTDILRQQNFQLDVQRDELHPGATEMIIHCIPARLQE